MRISKNDRYFSFLKLLSTFLLKSPVRAASSAEGRQGLVLIVKQSELNLGHTAIDVGAIYLGDPRCTACSASHHY